MERKILIAGIVLLIVSLIGVGCSSIQQAKTDLTQAQQDLATAKGTLSNTEATLSAVRATLSTTESELNALKAKCAPGNFTTVSELESWVSSHVQPTTTSTDQWFQGALRVQEAGLKDGYLISVNIDYDANTDMYTIACNAMAAGSLYTWNPETAAVHPWGADFTG
jgi:hypothetical protein